MLYLNRFVGINEFCMHVCDVSYNFVYIVILFISRILEVVICDIKIIGDTHHYLVP